MDTQGQSFNLDPNATNTGSPAQNPPANPLNTGNGAPIQEMPTEQLTPATKGLTAPQPMPITATNPPAPPTQSIEPNLTASPSPIGPEKSGKKIIIYVIIAILFAAVAYGAYLFFKKGSDEPEANAADKPPTIDIATPEEDSTSAKMEELEAVVEELREVYGDNPATDEVVETEETSEPDDITAAEDETTSPPSLTLGDNSEETPKVLR